MYPSEQRTMQNIQELARNAYANHTLEVRLSQWLFRNWRCATPGTGFHAFNVSTEPGRLFVTGDMEPFIFQREQNMLAWLRRGCLNDPYYLASKVVAGKVHCWCPDYVLDWLESEYQECRAELSTYKENPNRDEEALLHERLLKLSQLRECVWEGKHGFLQALIDSRLRRDMDYPAFETFSPGFLWAREALRWFLAHLEGA